MANIPATRDTEYIVECDYADGTTTRRRGFDTLSDANNHARHMMVAGADVIRLVVVKTTTERFEYVGVDPNPSGAGGAPR